MGIHSHPHFKDPLLKWWPSKGRLIVFDLEYTAWDGSWQRAWSEPWEHREIVQIGAVLVDVSQDFATVDKYSRFVRPTHNPELSDYFISLTGISQQTVNREGIPFSQAYEEFLSFSGETNLFFSNGLDGEVLRENCHLNGIEYQLQLGSVVNIRAALARAISSVVGRELGSVDSGDLVRTLEINASHSGNKHDALADAEGIVLALRALREISAI